MEAFALVIALAGMGAFGIPAFLTFWLGVFAFMVMLGLVMKAADRVNARWS